MKKFFILAVLFALPLVAYLFFSSGVNKFARLPVLTKDIGSLENFKNLKNDTLTFNNKITVLGFFGENPIDYTVGAYNLAEKIYDTYYKFKDFQFLIIVAEGKEEEVANLQKSLSKVVDMEKWKFAYGTPSEIKSLFTSLNTSLNLNENLSTPNVFIVDKNAALRGRNDDEDENKGVLYGYDSRSISEINNKMDDDVKVILAEYRLALKKYNSKLDK